MKIHTANIDWQSDNNGLTVPVSADFGDVYFCKDNGLAESRYVFVEQNQLAQRFSQLVDFECFLIGEIGFGTGLNVLATWQLWQEIYQQNPKNQRLHIITTEKFPLTKADLAKSLTVWKIQEPKLCPLIDELLDNYPPPLAGCHRLQLSDNVTLDIWLGDACDSLSQIIGNCTVNAWFLDGFAPSCNNELWSAQLFSQIKRLSDEKTTLATFSVSKIVKKNLIETGFQLKKIKGFGKKREMLTAIFANNHQEIYQNSKNFSNYQFRYNKKIPPFWTKIPFQKPLKTRQKTTKKVKKPDFCLPNLVKSQQKLSIAVIGAGVAGLSCAYALAKRGHQVTIFDKNQPLSGASGNIRGVLAPKLSDLAHLSQNLHSIGFLAGCRFYVNLAKQSNLEIFTKTGCLDLLSHNRVALDDVQDFPPTFAEFLNQRIAKNLSNFDVGQAIFIPHAGLIHTQNFAKAVLAHPNIAFCLANLQSFEQKNGQVLANFANFQQHFDHIILCMALDTCDFLPQIKRFNHSRGQVSWLPIDDKTQQNLPKLPLKYGSYFATFQENQQNFVMLGASFVRDTLDITPKTDDLLSNIDDFCQAIPSLENQEIFQKNNLNQWLGRASIRCQTVDYLPLVGQIGTADSRVWTFSALGSKGYAYSPICSELIAGLMLGEVLPLSATMVKKLNPNRQVLQK